MTTNDLLCPFAELLDRRLLGAASAEDRARLEEHVASGCPTCKPRWQEEQGLERLIEGAFRPLEEELEGRRGDVLAGLHERLSRDEDRRAQRRVRRVGMNALLLITVLFGVVLLSVEYLMTAAVWKRLVSTQVEVAGAEIYGLVIALEKYGRDHGELPADDTELVKALSRLRKDGVRAYYTGARVDAEGRVLDPWKNPYLYRRTVAGARFWSCGPNGKDDHELGDDIARDLVLLPR